VTVDTETVPYDFSMTPLSPLLAKVEITETVSSPLIRRLDRVGFVNRSHSEDGLFIKHDDMMNRKPQTLRDVLGIYGLRENSEYILDRMPLAYYDVLDYPIEMIAGIEVYRHGRPIEFSRTRRGPTLLDQGGGSFLMQALVVIWTYIPAS